MALKIEVGQVWKLDGGGDVTIVAKNEGTPAHPWIIRMVNAEDCEDRAEREDRWLVDDNGFPKIPAAVGCGILWRILTAALR